MTSKQFSFKYRTATSFDGYVIDGAGHQVPRLIFLVDLNRRSKICEEKSTNIESVDLEVIENITCKMYQDFECFILFVVL